jgi:hypothetical protein
MSYTSLSTLEDLLRRSGRRVECLASSHQSLLGSMILPSDALQVIRDHIIRQRAV